MKKENRELRKIKKKYGEDFSHLCRRLFPTILDKEGLLWDILISHFDFNKCLCKDLVEQGRVVDFRNYIYNLSGLKDQGFFDSGKSVEELASCKGYHVVEVKTVDELRKYSKYYDDNELICTIRNLDIGENRLDTHRIFFFIKDDIDNVRRKDFTNPCREDVYSTSCLCVQFSKDRYHDVNIISRYNHSVSNPNAVYGNDLECIMEGLTCAFSKEYGLKKSYDDKKRFKLVDYVDCCDMFYKENVYIDGVSYCANNVIINGGVATHLPTERYILMDYFVVDVNTGEISLPDPTVYDGFLFSMDDVVGVKKEKNNNGSTLLFSTKNGEDIKIMLNKSNSIIGIVNNNEKSVMDNFMIDCRNVSYVEMNGAESVRDNFMYSANGIDEVHMDNVVVFGNKGFYRDCGLKKVSFPSLERVGDGFISTNYTLDEFLANKLWCYGDGFLEKSVQCGNLHNCNVEGFECGKDSLSDKEKIYALFGVNLNF